MRINLITILFSLLISVQLAAQESRPGEFYQGKIKFLNGVEVEGQLSWKVDEIIVIANGIENAYFASEVDHFKVIDQAKERMFYSLPDESQIKEEFFFFEVVFEKPTFAFLLKTKTTSKEKPINPSLQKKGNYVPNNISRVYGTYTSIRMEESLFYATPEGISPLVIYTSTDGRSAIKYLDKKMLSEFSNRSFNEILKKAEQDGLDLKQKGDMIQLLKVYSGINPESL